MARWAELRNNNVVKIAKAPVRELSTREALARSILQSGPLTAVALAEQLHITPAGIRRHLDALVEEGILEAREPYPSQQNQRGRGRPSKVFVMTDAGREKFEHSYDDLAVHALKFMSQKNGQQMVKEFAHARAQEIARKIQKNLAQSRSQREKIKVLANELTNEGYATTVQQRAHGEEICQHHCPVAHVAAEFPEICEAETEIFSQVLGTHVQRLATIAHGDGVCTTFVPNGNSPQARSSKKQQPHGERKKAAAQ